MKQDKNAAKAFAEKFRKAKQGGNGISADDGSHLKATKKPSNASLRRSGTRGS